MSADPIPMPLLFDARGRAHVFDLAPKYRHWSQALARAIVATWAFALENHVPMDEARHQMAQRIRRRLAKQGG